MFQALTTTKMKTSNDCMRHAVRYLDDGHCCIQFPSHLSLPYPSHSHPHTLVAPDTNSTQNADTLSWHIPSTFRGTRTRWRDN